MRYRNVSISIIIKQFGESYLLSIVASGVFLEELCDVRHDGLLIRFINIHI